MSVFKKCYGPCNKELEETLENFYKRTDRDKFYNECKLCMSIRKKANILKNPEKYKQSAHETYIRNKDKIIKKGVDYAREKRKTNPSYKLRCKLSSSIRNALKRNKGSKLGGSILDNFPYSIEELKQHIQSLFEPWMNWENWGAYNPNTWNDNDSSTWTWNIDHVVPHSDLPYDSMEHENFHKTWSLSNLRPYSAKLNVLDGVKRIRHKK